MYVEGIMKQKIKSGNWLFRKDYGEPFIEIIFTKNEGYIKMIVGEDGTKQIL